MEHLETIAKVCGYLATISGFVAIVWKCIREQKLIREGQKCQLRDAMLKTYHSNKESRKLRQYEAENFVMMYQAYKAMGGNSFIDEIYDHVTKWEVEI